MVEIHIFMVGVLLYNWINCE